MKQLFITDMDGTLLNRESCVSDTSASIISRLSRSGALITVATARTPATVEPLLAHTLTTPPAIVMTGAALWNRYTQSFIKPHFIAPATVQLIISAFRGHDITPFSYTIGSNGIIHTYFDGKPNRKEQKFIDERSHLKLKRIHINERAVDAPACYPDTILIFALGPLAQVYRLADYLRENVTCAVSSYPDIFNPDIAYIEIFAPGVSKAAAVNDLRSHIDADRVIVFGDNINDLPMMQVADVAVAVDNALPLVKEAADIVIDSNANDAVARWIENYL